MRPLGDLVAGRHELFRARAEDLQKLVLPVVARGVDERGHGLVGSRELFLLRLGRCGRNRRRRNRRLVHGAGRQQAETNDSHDAQGGLQHREVLHQVLVAPCAIAGTGRDTLYIIFVRCSERLLLRRDAPLHAGAGRCRHGLPLPALRARGFPCRVRRIRTSAPWVLIAPEPGDA